MAVEARARGKPSDHSARDATRLTSVVGELAMSNKLVKKRMAGRMWVNCGAGSIAERTREECSHALLTCFEQTFQSIE